MIDGVRVVPLQRIPDERGVVAHMLRSSDEHFLGFGEIYFSTVYPGVVKGWHRHFPATLNYVCIVGEAKVVLCDRREGSSTYDEVMELFIGRSSYSLIQVPPNIWNGFKAVGSEPAMIANCCTHAHGEFESERLDPFDNDLPYDWDLRQH